MTAPRPTIGDGRCQVCRGPFRYSITWTGDTPSPPPPICGRLPCRARHGWGAAEWAGRARMAAARLRAGIELDGLDREALARADGVAA